VKSIDVYLQLAPDAAYSLPCEILHVWACGRFFARPDWRKNQEGHRRRSGCRHAEAVSRMRLPEEA